MEVSIIIPAYNAAETLPQTLRSVFASSPAQDNGFEVIVVDDGSSDRTGSQLAAEFPQQLASGLLHYHYQPNAGVSVARNTGLSLAQGRYVTFVDADDEVQNDYIFRLYELIQQHPDVDVFEFGYKTYREQVGNILGSGHVNRYRGMNPRERALEGAVSSFVWLVMCRLIRADLAKSASFPAGIKYCEDLMYLCTVYAQATTFYTSEQELYRYRIGETSAISRVTMEQCQQVRDFLDNFNALKRDDLNISDAEKSGSEKLKKVVDANLYYMFHSAGKRTMPFLRFFRQVKRLPVITIFRLYSTGLLSRRKTMICLFPSLYFFGHRMKRR
ncbi:glycosyltransferase family 2 protein [Vibrio mangrovi]|uniref:Glycosyltransferase family A protein n=1 Tax=Vibrio mangrovi TaxID=474394 RepID=A0A1Y6IZ61_9VIBR|nr:glycosyltransferase family A protein [Vibrio mangrovi]MDW6003091.1 glycosyltransferase family A protein [Vibrio mangrovi]SMS01333.1 putative glycosyltransferase EpsJ [Vibrio mangrovi]